MKILQIVFAIVITMFASVSSAGIFKLNVSDDGILLGAENVEVNDKFYNVSFQDSTCILLYNRCDATSDCVFNTQASATAASEALLAQVFIDGSAGLFRVAPELIYGCSESGSGPTVCVIATPYGFFNDNIMFPRTVAVDMRAAWCANVFACIPDQREVRRFILNASTDYGAVPTFTHAVWAVAEVPAPVPSF